jgi:lysozyme
MKTSPDGLEFIARWEGEVLHPYHDQAGLLTIGVGHLIRSWEEYSNGITHDQAMALLAGDVSVAEEAVLGSLQVDLAQYQFDACVSFTFNCGGGAWRMSSVRKFCNEQNWEVAAKSFLLWDKRRDPATGQLVVDQGLLRRRQAEAALFSGPSGMCGAV